MTDSFQTYSNAGLVFLKTMERPEWEKIIAIVPLLSPMVFIFGILNFFFHWL